MSGEKLLSIIVPVYNVEAYLPECVESILQIGENNFELLLIDDGSTDCSGAICDRYAEKHSSIKAVHKENEGLSITRNLGLDLACAKYIAFVDADDRLTPGSLAPVLNWAEKSSADLCFMKGRKLFSDGSMEDLGDGICREHISGKEKQQVIDYLSSRPKYPGSACTKLFRRDFLNENALRFPASRSVAEDLTFCLNAFLAADSFDALDIPYYEYRQNRDGSITNKITEKNFSGLNEFIENSIDRLTDNGRAKSRMCEAAMSFAAYEYAILLWQYSLLDDASKAAAMERLKKNKWVLKFSRTKKARLVSACVSLLGLDLTSKILKAYMSTR